VKKYVVWSRIAAARTGPAGEAANWLGISANASSTQTRLADHTDVAVSDRPASNPLSPIRAILTQNPSGTPVREESEESLRQVIASLRQGS
jgi:hypothetical protein